MHETAQLADLLQEDARLLRRMDGNSQDVRAGDRVEYGESPVLVEHGGK